MNLVIHCYLLTRFKNARVDRSIKSRELKEALELLETAGVVLVEIKSGPTGRMKSMHMFIEKYSTENAIRISQAPFKKGHAIISIPFYGIESYF